MFRVEINTDNDAFQGQKIEEIARILRSIATNVESGRANGAIIDSNGNKVGKYSIT